VIRELAGHPGDAMVGLIDEEVSAQSGLLLVEMFRRLNHPGQPDWAPGHGARLGGHSPSESAVDSPGSAELTPRRSTAT